MPRATSVGINIISSTWKERTNYNLQLFFDWLMPNLPIESWQDNCYLVIWYFKKGKQKKSTAWPNGVAKSASLYPSLVRARINSTLAIQRELYWNWGWINAKYHNDSDDNDDPLLTVAILMHIQFVSELPIKRTNDPPQLKVNVTKRQNNYLHCSRRATRSTWTICLAIVWTSKM